jgi:hypothetical protein
MADVFKIAGTVLGPGPRGIAPPGLIPAVGQGVDLFTCMRQQGCLLSPGAALLMATTDDSGMYMFAAPRSIVRNRLWVLIQAVVGGVRCRVLLSPSRLEALASAGAVLEGGAAGLPLIVIDPIQEAAVRLLEAAGVENYDDDGIDAVVDAVEQANATTAFDGLSVAQANDLAEVTAANDPEVQMVLAARKRTPTPTATAMPPGCAGDCDGSGSVGVNELIRGVNISLGNASLSICPAFDRDGSQTVSIGELIGAVNRSLKGC